MVYMTAITVAASKRGSSKSHCALIISAGARCKKVQLVGAIRLDFDFTVSRQQAVCLHDAAWAAAA